MKTIYLEGIDGSGKSTAVHHLSKEYENVYFHSFPYYDETRNIIMEEKAKANPNWGIVMSAFFLDNLAAEASFKIKGYPTVFCDRFWPSTYAYNKDITDKTLFNNLMTTIKDRETPPDLIIYLDIEPINGVTRVVNEYGGEVKESSINYLEDVKIRYTEILSYYNNVHNTKIVTIDVNDMNQQELVPRIKELI